VAKCAHNAGCNGFDVSWLDQTLDELSRLPVIGYMPGGRAAAEPTALAALAFAAHGRIEEATKAAVALVSMQQTNGEVAVRALEKSPGWPTSLSICAWIAIDAPSHRGLIRTE